MAKSGKKKATDAEKKRRRAQAENSKSDKSGTTPDGKKSPNSRIYNKGRTPVKAADASVQTGGPGRLKQDP
jgi:hypothetical protein